MKRAVCDIEVYRNYFLVMFKGVESGKVLAYEMYEGHPLDTKAVAKVLLSFEIVTFNGNSYDIPMLALACTGVDNAMLKRASDAIIVHNLRRWDFERAFEVQMPPINHIDLIEVAPGKASLKTYGGRMHSRRLQDLPIEPDAEITPEQRELLRRYCENDLDTTIDLLKKLTPQIDLRVSMSHEYGIDLRSKSDAQIAEAVISHQLQRIMNRKVERPNVPPGTTFRYQTPSFIQYLTPTLQDTLRLVQESEFVVSDTGKVEMPKALETARIAIGNSVYRMGIGGLHSSETNAAHVTDGSFVLIDRDVASYYPSIVLRCRLAPEHMGDNFLKVYRTIVERRLAAKRAKDTVTADSLKITINGSFGKLGSKWSRLYAPNLMIQVTITGQLSLLMLIEMLELAGISVVSANTDGVVIKCPVELQDEMEWNVKVWEAMTGFETEATPYRAIYSRDVNNYIAVKPNGDVKSKGAYAEIGMQKNPTNLVCVDAVKALLVKGTPVEETILNCQDVRRFLTVRSVTGGAVIGETYLGKVVRWYYARGVEGAIHYKSNGNKVPRSDGAKPLMELPDALPDDINYDWYITEAKSILSDIGYVSA